MRHVGEVHGLEVGVGGEEGAEADVGDGGAAGEGERDERVHLARHLVDASVGERGGARNVEAAEAVGGDEEGGRRGPGALAHLCFPRHSRQLLKDVFAWSSGVHVSHSALGDWQGAAARWAHWWRRSERRRGCC